MADDRMGCGDRGKSKVRVTNALTDFPVICFHYHPRIEQNDFEPVSPLVTVVVIRLEVRLPYHTLVPTRRNDARPDGIA